MWETMWGAKNHTYRHGFVVTDSLCWAPMWDVGAGYLPPSLSLTVGQSQ